MQHKRHLCFPLIGLLLRAATANAQLPNNTFTVDSPLDLPDADPADGQCATAPPNPVCTLRAAVMQANNGTAGPYYIELPAGTYVLTRSGDDQTADLGDLDVSCQLDIHSTSTPVVIDANGAVTGDRAFEVINGSLILRNLTIKNGKTTGYGGAIYVHGNSSLLLENVEILDSTAGIDGGGVYVVGGADIMGGLVQGNISQGDGGGICALGSGFRPTFTLNGTTVANNQSMAGSGGGVSLSGFYSGGIENSSVHDNSATGNGGGVESDNGLVSIDASSFTHNTTTNGLGGGLYSNGSAVISASQFTTNSAGAGGGGMALLNSNVGCGFCPESGDIVVTSNQAGFGGGLYIYQSTFLLNHAWIEGNIATSSGGGIFITGSFSEVIDSSILKNRASADGGGIATYDDSTVMTSAIYANHALRGGGIFAGDAAVTTIQNSTLDGNSASASGGGVSVDGTAMTSLFSATITGNTARTAYPSPGTGGGIFVAASASATATASVFGYNTSADISFSNCAGTLNLADANLVANSNGCTITIASGATGNQVGIYPNSIDPGLSALQPLYDPALPAHHPASAKFGRVPLAGSPLIDAGPANNGCVPPAPPYDADTSWDEIGQNRALNGRCDIGAIEYGAALDRVFENGFDD